MTDSAVTVRHQPERHRYVIEADGEEAGFAAYTERNGLRLFDHSEIYPAFRGRGLITPLFQAALSRSRADGFEIAAECSAVVRFLEKYPEYA